MKDMSNLSGRTLPEKLLVSISHHLVLRIAAVRSSRVIEVNVFCHISHLRCRCSVFVQELATISSLESIECVSQFFAGPISGGLVDDVRLSRWFTLCIASRSGLTPWIEVKGIGSRAVNVKVIGIVPLLVPITKPHCVRRYLLKPRRIIVGNRIPRDIRIPIPTTRIRHRRARLIRIRTSKPPPPRVIIPLIRILQPSSIPWIRRPVLGTWSAAAAKRLRLSYG